MRRLTSIVAVNRAGVIGCRNSLPWRVKSDLAFFKATTSSNVVVMGRKTYDSLGRCLPNHYNVVLSKQFNLFADQPNCVLREGIDAGIAEAEQAPSIFSEIFVIGGATMYSQFHDMVDRYLITIVDKAVEDGDAFFDLSLFNQPDEWSVSRVLGRSQGEGDEASFEVFELVSTRVEARRQKRLDIVNAIREKRLSRSGSARRLRGGKSAVISSPVFNWL